MEDSSKPLILIVDDDASLREVLRDYFGGRGYCSRELPDASALESTVRALSPALVILDRMMPGEDGVLACRRLRARGCDVPVILLTAVDETIDRVIGLESGADDYVGKPFDPRELEARVATILRRPRRFAGDATSVGFGPFAFNLELRVLMRAGVPVALTPRESTLLWSLLTSAPRPLTRDQLLDCVGGEAAQFDRAVDAAIYRLRRIIEDDPARPRFIRTIRGVGYVFDRAPPDSGVP
jgi:two-component system phosphate regulon response regulator OmpR